MDGWRDELMIEIMKSEKKNDPMKQWMTDWLTEWMNGWVNEWMDEWMNEWRKVNNIVTSALIDFYADLIHCYSTDALLLTWVHPPKEVNGRMDRRIQEEIKEVIEEWIMKIKTMDEWEIAFRKN